LVKVEMTCWKWFGSVLKEAGVEVTDKNQKKVDDLIHHYIGEQSSYGRCSADWRKARKEIEADEKMKKELIAKLKTLV
jgi:predicted Fe-Mo cluster-binding NifX family protein